MKFECGSSLKGDVSAALRSIKEPEALFFLSRVRICLSTRPM